jgi:hypothetical protein
VSKVWVFYFDHLQATNKQKRPKLLNYRSNFTCCQQLACVASPCATEMDSCLSAFDKLRVIAPDRVIVDVSVEMVKVLEDALLGFVICTVLQ